MVRAHAAASAPAEKLGQVAFGLKSGEVTKHRLSERSARSKQSE
jgi:hypothetical protein